MSMKTLFKSWKNCASEEKGTTELTSSRSLRHKKVTFGDTSKEKSLLRTASSTATKSKGKEETSTPPQSIARVKGHDNVLFCFEGDDDDDFYVQFPRLRVEYSHQLGGKGKAEGQLQDATDVKCTDHEHILVTDLINSRVQLFSMSGEVVRIYQSEEMLEPWACALSPDGQVLAVTSRKTQKAMLVGREDGKVRGHLGKDQFFSCPSGLAVTSQGHWIVTDIATGKVSIFTAEGAFFKQLGAGSVTFYQPRYVTVSRYGDVIVSDSGNHRLVVFDKEYNFVRTMGTFGKGNGCLKCPHGVCTDNMGNIVVCDRYNDRVSVFTRHGDFVHHLVTSEHKLRHPQGLALSSDMDLYVSHGGLKAHSVMMLHIRPRRRNSSVVIEL